MKKILLYSMSILNLILLYIFFFFKGFKPVDLYFSHYLLVILLSYLVYGYELKFGLFRYLKNVNSLIDMPISKFEAVQLDLKMFYKSKILALFLYSNLVFICFRFLFFHDIVIIDFLKMTFFFCLLIFSLINITSILKAYWGFQSFIYVLFSIIFLIQISGEKWFNYEITHATKTNFLIMLVLFNSIIIIIKKILFKTWL